MSYFVSKIGHLDPRFYSLIYCAIPGVQMSGVQMSDFISKIGHLDPRFYSVIYCAIPGVQMSGVQMSGVQMSGVQMSGVQMYPTRFIQPSPSEMTKLLYYISNTLSTAVGTVIKDGWGVGHFGPQKYRGFTTFCRGFRF